MATGRFAPSPTGPLHVGNLRTALLAWLFARAVDSPFLLRVEDLDPVASRHEHEVAQLDDLRALGLDWDGDVMRQSERRAAHDQAIAALEQAGVLYACYCTRREIAEAAVAPHGPRPEGAYAGTCRELTAAARAAHESAGRRPALRVRAAGERVSFVDRLHGAREGILDDFVVRRGDGTPAYQLAVVVDDAAQAVEEVVRGDDLLDTTARQVWLARALHLEHPAYAHVPLVLGPDGERLAKRHGAVTLDELRARGTEPAAVLATLATSLGLAAPGESPTAHQLIDRFDVDALPRSPWTFAVPA
jgi:glutamyl-tRNA synthetase